MPPRIGQWREVETALSAEIAAGRLAPGQKLPPEPELCARFGVGRHSLRRALAALVAAGRLRVQQGSGTYVADRALLRYQIGPRTRFSRNLMSQGVAGQGELLRAETVAAPPEVAQALALPAAAPVHRLEVMGLADGVPVSLSTAWHPAEALPRMLMLRRTGASVTEAYAAHGITDYVRRDTTITARPALRSEAVRLAQGEERPVIVVVKTDVDLTGRPIGHSEVVWSAERVQFTIDTAGTPEPAEAAGHTTPGKAATADPFGRTTP